MKLYAILAIKMSINYEEFIGGLVILMLVLAFNIISLKYILFLKYEVGDQPLYERSGHLVILAIISNCAESILNIIRGITLYFLRIDSFDLIVSLLPFGIYAARLFSGCMCLRILRMKYLYDKRLGYIHKELKMFESKIYSIIVPNLYSATIVIIYVVIFLLFQDIEKNYNMIKVINGIEGFAFVVLSYKYFNYTNHPSISVEYVLYSIIWISGIESEGKIRYLFMIPIRNCMILTVTVLSLYIHSEMIAPPLPLDITFNKIFIIQELYCDFNEYINKYGNKIEKDSFKCYSDLMIYGETAEVCIKDSIMKLSIAIRPNNSMNSQTIEQMEEILERGLCNILKSYLISDEYIKMRKEYFIVNS